MQPLFPLFSKAVAGGDPPFPFCAMFAKWVARGLPPCTTWHFPPHRYVHVRRDLTTRLPPNGTLAGIWKGHMAWRIHIVHERCRAGVEGLHFPRDPPPSWATGYGPPTKVGIKKPENVLSGSSTFCQTPKFVHYQFLNGDQSPNLTAGTYGVSLLLCPLVLTQLIISGVSYLGRRNWTWFSCLIAWRMFYLQSHARKKIILDSEAMAEVSL